MTSDRCCVCGNVPYCKIFFLWTSSRYFPVNELIQKMKWTSKQEKKNVYDGKRVCFYCLNKLKK